MGKLKDLTIVKLGGSLITNKDRYLTPNIRKLTAVAREIVRYKTGRTNRLFLIHGGGSFGHYYAKKFGLSNINKRYSAEAISKTAESMIQLHSIVLEHLNDAGLNCMTFSSSEFLKEDGFCLSETGLENLENLYRCQLVPLSFGNIFINRIGSMIVSGDQIALALARSVRTARVIFAMDVDGVYASQDLKPPIIDRLDQSAKIATANRKYDVTGGIDRKIRVGFELRNLGASVFYVSGWKKHRLERLLAGRSDVMATKICASGLSKKPFK